MSDRSAAKRKAVEGRKRTWRTTLRRGTKRVAVGWWSSDDGTECYGDHWAPTCCFGEDGGRSYAVQWDGMVEASIMAFSDGEWRVCVWGGDDFGVEFDTMDERLARRLFDRINHLVMLDDLWSWGFVPA